MRKLILFLLLSTSLFSVEINKDNILKYVFISRGKLEYKVTKRAGLYYLIDLPRYNVVISSRDLDVILSCIKDKDLKISREWGKLDVFQCDSK